MNVPRNGAHSVEVAGRHYRVHFVDGIATQVDVSIAPRGLLGSRPYDRALWRLESNRSKSNRVREAIATAIEDAAQSAQ